MMLEEVNPSVLKRASRSHAAFSGSGEMGVESRLFSRTV